MFTFLYTKAENKNKKLKILHVFKGHRGLTQILANSLVYVNNTKLMSRVTAWLGMTRSIGDAKRVQNQTTIFPTKYGTGKNPIPPKKHSNTNRG